jgi:hypothetical protein
MSELPHIDFKVVLTIMFGAGIRNNRRLQ